MANRTAGRFAAKGEDWVPKKLRELEQEIRELKAARTLESASIGAGGLQIVDGGTLSVDGDADFSGDTTIGGNLSVPNGSITNAALLNPIMFAAANDTQGNVGLSSSSISTPISVTITVPAGFTKAVVIATADMVMSASGGSATGATVLCRIAGVSAPFGVTTDFPGSAASSSYSKVVTGLSGGDTIAVSAQAAAQGANIPAAAGNQISITALAAFAR